MDEREVDNVACSFVLVNGNKVTNYNSLSARQLSALQDWVRTIGYSVNYLPINFVSTTNGGLYGSLDVRYQLFVPTPSPQNTQHLLVLNPQPPGKAECQCIGCGIVSTRVVCPGSQRAFRFDQLHANMYEELRRAAYYHWDLRNHLTLGEYLAREVVEIITDFPSSIQMGGLIVDTLM